MPAATLAKPSFLRTVTLTMAAVIGLFIFDGTLARIERAETVRESVRFFESGQHLLQTGQNELALDQFRGALAIDRENQTYQLALGNALLASGRLADAETALGQLLQRNSNAGESNLLMARVLAKQGRWEDAVSYYHRAIYGQWKDDIRGNRARVRKELDAFLTAHPDQSDPDNLN